jgi:hypothetical protein
LLERALKGVCVYIESGDTFYEHCFLTQDQFRIGINDRTETDDLHGSETQMVLVTIRLYARIRVESLSCLKVSEAFVYDLSYSLIVGKL